MIDTLRLAFWLAVIEFVPWIALFVVIFCGLVILVWKGHKL